MARNGRPKVPLVLTPNERAALQRQLGERRGSRAAALRARVILACSEGRNNRDVARAFDLAEHTVGKWRRRFVEGRLDGLRDRRSSTARPVRVRLAGLHELTAKLFQGAPFGPWSLGQALQPAVLQAPRALAN